MTLTLLHTADWQIGKPFGRFEAEKAAVLRHARLAAVDRLAAAARRAGAIHILVAGDVFDGEALPDAVVRQLMARLAAVSDLVWHLLPGNHDPARPGGVWDTVRAGGVPANVRLHLTEDAAEIARGVYLLPAPLRAKASASDPTAWMDAAPTPPGSLRIGLAHGSVQGFGSLGEAAVPIDPTRARRAGLAYLALGDWHGVKEIGPATWYAGTPEPDSFADNAPGHAVVVRFETPGAAPRVEVVGTAQYTWIARTIELARSADLAPLEAEAAGWGAAAASRLLDLRLTGRLAPRDAGDLQRRLEALAAGLFDLGVDRRQLGVEITAGDIAGLSDPVLADVADGLRVRATGAEADSDAGRVAARALELLLALDAEAGGSARP